MRGNMHWHIRINTEHWKHIPHITLHTTHYTLHITTWTYKTTATLF